MNCVLGESVPSPLIVAVVLLPGTCLVYTHTTGVEYKLGSDIFREKIYNCINTSDMQRGDELHCFVDIRELYSTLYFVLHVGEGDGTNLSHLSVS